MAPSSSGCPTWARASPRPTSSPGTSPSATTSASIRTSSRSRPTRRSSCCRPRPRRRDAPVRRRGRQRRRRGAARHARARRRRRQRAGGGRRGTPATPARQRRRSLRRPRAAWRASSASRSGTSRAAARTGASCARTSSAPRRRRPRRPWPAPRRRTRPAGGAGHAGAVRAPQPGEVVPLRGVRRAIAHGLTKAWLEVPADHRLPRGRRDGARGRPHAAQAPRPRPRRRGARPGAYADAAHRQGGRASASRPPLRQRLDRPRARGDHAPPRAPRRYRVGGPDGLVVPVVHDAGRRTLAEVALEVVALTRAGPRAPVAEQLAGATFTVNNYGGLGLAGHADRPPARGRQPRRRGDPRPGRRGRRASGRAATLALAVAGDHRVLDGHTLAAFVSQVVALLEDPVLLLEDPADGRRRARGARRPARARRRPGRLRRRDPRRAARAVGDARGAPRPGRARRRLPARRLHPEQGAHRGRRCRAPHRGARPRGPGRGRRRRLARALPALARRALRRPRARVAELLDAGGTRVVHGRRASTGPTGSPSGRRRAACASSSSSTRSSRQARGRSSSPGSRFDGERVLDDGGARTARGARHRRRRRRGLHRAGTRNRAGQARRARDVVEALDRVLPTVGGRSGPVLRRLRALGVDVHSSTTAQRLDGGALVVLGPGGEEDRLEAERVVVAVGRVPNTDALGSPRPASPSARTG